MRYLSRFVLARKRPILDDSEDEDDGGTVIVLFNWRFCSIFFLEMEDFIVDDDEDEGFDYRKELQETLKKNFRFDPERSARMLDFLIEGLVCVFRYRKRILDDDDDDLRNMESTFDQIEKEEDFRLVE